MTFTAVLAVAVIAAVGISAEEVPCRNGQTVCNGAESLSVISNNYYCCDHGFNMQWRNEVVNGTAVTECMCNRYYVVSDCIDGQAQCQGATSLTSDGTSVKCCKNGDSMNSVSNSIVNGVRANYCKCVRYLSNQRGATGIFRGRQHMNVGRVMTPEERRLFAQQMGQWSNNFRAEMDQMSNTLRRNLMGIESAFRPPARTSGGFGNWAANFLEGLGRGLQQGLDQAYSRAGDPFQRQQSQQPTDPNDPNNPNPSNPSTATTQPANVQRPQLTRQQQIQLMQQRMRQQQAQQNSFLGRLQRNPVFGQMMTPTWWTSQDWRGLFGIRNNATNTNRPGQAAAPASGQNPQVVRANP